jgi:hypothetical protein
MKLVGMSMMFHVTGIYLPKRNGSSVVSVKPNMNFNSTALHLRILGFPGKSSY